MFVASHPDMFKDYTTTVYGYKKSLPSLNSQEHQIFLYIKLNTKRLHKNNSADMLNFVYENFVKCIKQKDSSYFISGNTPNNHFIVLVQSEDEGVLISGDCYISDTIKLTNYDLKCDVLFCNSDLDWTPYNKPYSISILPKSADIEQSHKRLEFMVNKLK